MRVRLSWNTISEACGERRPGDVWPAILPGNLACRPFQPDGRGKAACTVENPPGRLAKGIESPGDPHRSRAGYQLRTVVR
jgi:hypothetical protein